MLIVTRALSEQVLSSFASCAGSRRAVFGQLSAELIFLRALEDRLIWCVCVAVILFCHYLFTPYYGFLSRYSPASVFIFLPMCISIKMSLFEIIDTAG